MKLICLKFGCSFVKMAAFVTLNFVLVQHSTAQLRMDASGNIGIGTTTPISRLEVNNGDLTLRAGASSATDPGDIIFKSATGSEYGRVFSFSNSLRIRSNPSSTGDININYSNGYVGIKTITPSYPLDVNGLIRCAGNTIISDRQLKSEITTLSYERIQSLYTLKGYTYKMDASALNNLNMLVDTTVHVGLIAQEVETVFPEMVDIDSFGIRSVEYTALIPVLIEVVKEQNKRITELENDILLISQNSNDPHGSTQNEIGFLSQNTPNPFDTDCKIDFKIFKENYTSATIAFYDLVGVEQHRVNIERGVLTGEIVLQSSSLYKGQFIYTLIVDGEIADSKKMIIQ